jgi:hypothetical protein
MLFLLLFCLFSREISKINLAVYLFKEQNTKRTTFIPILVEGMRKVITNVKNKLRNENHASHLLKKGSVYKMTWVASRQNQHNVFATSMDPDQPAQSDQDPCCSLQVSLLVIGFTSKRTAWILIRMCEYAVWFGYMLVAYPLCWLPKFAFYVLSVTKSSTIQDLFQI